VSYVQARVSEWSLLTFPSPILKLQHAPLPLKVLWARERAPTPPPSTVLYSNSLLSLARSWECVIFGRSVGQYYMIPRMWSKIEERIMWRLESFRSHVLKSCNFVLNIKLYQFWGTNQFYISIDFTSLLILGYN